MMTQKTLTLLAIAFLLSMLNLHGQQQDGNNRVTENYRLKTKDVIRVEVFQEPDLLREVRVNADGKVALPLVGNVTVGGMTVLDAQRLIRDLYEKDFLVNPQVNLLILEYAERRVSVTGQVNRPGPVVIPPEEEMTFTQAIAAANGLNLRAAENRIILTRMMPDGKPRKYTLDYDEIVEDPRKDMKLQDGDTIYVDESTF